MGKNKERQGAHGSDDDFDDASSMASSEMSVDGGGVEHVQDVGAVLGEIVDQLTEKRGATREKCLNGIAKLLQLHYLPEDVSRHHETILYGVQSGIKRGSAKEAAAAAKVLELLVITDPSNGEEDFQQTFPNLEAASKHHKNFAVRAACISAMATTCFVGSESPEELNDCLKLCSELYSSRATEAGVRAAALNAWGLLTSTIDERKFTAMCSNEMDAFVEALEDDNLAVRLAAGENIAVVFETLWANDEDQAEAALTDNLVELLTALAKDSDKSKHKKEKVKQRSLFREVLETVEAGTPPTDKIEIGKQKTEFESWHVIRQLDAFRDALGHGFHIHVKKNDLIRDIFDLGPISTAPQEKVSAVQKRLFGSKNSFLSKARTQHRDSQRTKKGNARELHDE